MLQRIALAVLAIVASVVAGPIILDAFGKVVERLRSLLARIPARVAGIRAPTAPPRSLLSDAFFAGFLSLVAGALGAVLILAPGWRAAHLGEAALVAGILFMAVPLVGLLFWAAGSTAAALRVRGREGAERRLRWVESNGDWIWLAAAISVPAALVGWGPLSTTAWAWAGGILGGLLLVGPLLVPDPPPSPFDEAWRSIRGKCFSGHPPEEDARAAARLADDAALDLLVRVIGGTDAQLDRLDEEDDAGDGRDEALAIQWSAVLVLSEVGPTAAERVVPLLDSGGPMARGRGAAAVLARAPVPTAVPGLRRALERTRDGAEAMFLLPALAACAGREAIPDLEAWLQPPERFLNGKHAARAAAQSLASLGAAGAGDAGDAPGA